MQAQNFKTATTDAAVPANAKGSSVQIGRTPGTRPKPEQFALIETLRLVQMLQHGPLTPRILRTRLRLDPEILIHHILQARHMGADIEKLVLDGRVFYCLNNWADCRKTVTRWIQLEEERDLRSEA